MLFSSSRLLLLGFAIACGSTASPQDAVSSADAPLPDGVLLDADPIDAPQRGDGSLDVLDVATGDSATFDAPRPDVGSTLPEDGEVCDPAAHGGEYCFDSATHVRCASRDIGEDSVIMLRPCGDDSRCETFDHPWVRGRCVRTADERCEIATFEPECRADGSHTYCDGIIVRTAACGPTLECIVEERPASPRGPMGRYAICRQAGAERCTSAECVEQPDGTTEAVGCISGYTQTQVCQRDDTCVISRVNDDEYVECSPF